MKKILAGVFALCFVLCSCDFATRRLIYHDKVSTGSFNGVIYNDTVYYYDEILRSLCYQNLNDISESALPLMNDPLIEDALNPFSNLSPGTFVLIDYNATSENNDYPVLIIAYKDTSNAKNIHYKIVSFDTKEKSIKIIKDGIYDNIQTLHLYNNVIYYTLNRGNKGYDMCRVDVTGKNFMQNVNTNHLLYRIHTIHNGKIYYTSDGLDKLYSCDLDFKNDIFIHDSVLKSTFFVYDDYLYFYDNLNITALDNFPVYTADLVRCNVSDYSLVEVVLSNISVGLDCNNKYYYIESSPRLINGTVFDDGTNKLCVLDLDTGTTTTIYDNDNDNVATFYTVLSEKWIVFKDIIYGENGSAEIFSYVMNTMTQEKTELP